MKTEMTSGIFEDCLVAEGNKEEKQYLLLMTTTKSLFLISYCHVTKECHRKVFHVHECSRNIQALPELITSLNRQSTWIRYKEMK